MGVLKLESRVIAGKTITRESRPDRLGYVYREFAPVGDGYGYGVKDLRGVELWGLPKTPTDRFESLVNAAPAHCPGGAGAHGPDAVRARGRRRVRPPGTAGSSWAGPASRPLTSTSRAGTAEAPLDAGRPVTIQYIHNLKDTQAGRDSRRSATRPRSIAWGGGVRSRQSS